jgi:hypothetical protein
MKIKGQKIEGPNVEVIVIPRGGDKQDIVFQAGAVLDFAPFEKMCPTPTPPSKILKGGKREYNLEDAGYKAALDVHSARRIAWMVLESLKATPDLEWETVKAGDARSWQNYEQELRDSGFSHVEIQRIINGVFAANCLSEARIEEARANFLRGHQEEPSSEPSGQSTEQPSS